MAKIVTLMSKYDDKAARLVELERQLAAVAPELVKEQRALKAELEGLKDSIRKSALSVNADKRPGLVSRFFKLVFKEGVRKWDEAGLKRLARKYHIPEAELYRNYQHGPAFYSLTEGGTEGKLKK